MEDGASRRVQRVAAAGASPRLPLLRRVVALESTLGLALRALGVLAVRRVTLAPKPFKARGIIGKLAHELHERVAESEDSARIGWFLFTGGMAHILQPLNVPQFTYTVKG